MKFHLFRFETPPRLAVADANDLFRKLRQKLADADLEFLWWKRHSEGLTHVFEAILPYSEAARNVCADWLALGGRWGRFTVVTGLAVGHQGKIKW